jgi:hypothetical protein
MKRGRGCSADLAGRPMRAHFTICSKRPAGSGHVRCRARNSKVKRGRPAGQLMKCGWGCGAQLTGSQVRAYFAICTEPAGGLRLGEPPGEALERQARTPTETRILCGCRNGARLTANGCGRVSPIAVHALQLGLPPPSTAHDPYSFQIPATEQNRWPLYRWGLDRSPLW